MGIQGLLQFLKPLLIEKRIADYSGQRIGIDSYCWYKIFRLHKAVYTCARDIAEGKPTRR